MFIALYLYSRKFSLKPKLYIVILGVPNGEKTTRVDSLLAVENHLQIYQSMAYGLELVVFK